MNLTHPDVKGEAKHPAASGETKSARELQAPRPAFDAEARFVDWSGLGCAGKPYTKMS